MPKTANGETAERETENGRNGWDNHAKLPHRFLSALLWRLLWQVCGTSGVVLLCKRSAFSGPETGKRKRVTRKADGSWRKLTASWRKADAFGELLRVLARKADAFGYPLLTQFSLPISGPLDACFVRSQSCRGPPLSLFYLVYLFYCFVFIV